MIKMFIPIQLYFVVSAKNWHPIPITDSVQQATSRPGLILISVNILYQYNTNFLGEFFKQENSFCLKLYVCTTPQTSIDEAY